MTYIQERTCQIPDLSKFYDTIFGDIKGVFVDVGAHDGQYCSNTYSLAVAGWYGLCVEPVDDLYMKCVNLHHGRPINVLRAVVGNHNGWARLYLTGNPTISEEVVAKGSWGFTYDRSNFKDVACYTLDTLLTGYGFKTNFEVLSIDVEGAELEVLSQFNIRHWHPKMMIIETHKLNEHESYRLHSDQIEQVVLSAGYKEIYCDNINSIYVPDK